MAVFTRLAAALARAQFESAFGTIMALACLSTAELAPLRVGRPDAEAERFAVAFLTACNAPHPSRAPADTAGAFGRFAAAPIWVGGS